MEKCSKLKNNNLLIHRKTLQQLPYFFYFFKELAAKEKLEIIIGVAPSHFQNFAGGFPRRLRRRNAFGLIQEYSTSPLRSNLF